MAKGKIKKIEPVLNWSFTLQGGETYELRYKGIAIGLIEADYEADMKAIIGSLNSTDTVIGQDLIDLYKGADWDKQDPEEKHWKDLATFNERFSHDEPGYEED